MMKENSRRNFLKISGLAAAASVAPLPKTIAAPQKKSAKLNLGLASYSLRKFDQAKTIAMAKRAGLDFMCFKSMHLPLDSTADQLKAGATNVKNAGMRLYGGGVIYMKSKTEVDQAFEYAKAAGMNVIVGVPEHELL